MDLDEAIKLGAAYYVRNTMPTYSLVPKIIQTLKPTVIFVTHDMVEALLVADRIGVMADGVLLQIDKPATLLNEPATAQVAALFEAPRRQSAILSGWLKQPNV